MQAFHYEIHWPVTASRPGHHRGRRSGSGFEFHSHAPLLEHPDPRRIDLHASLRDPFGNWSVRVFRQRSAIPVYVLADVSASMGFMGVRRKLDVVADFAAAAAYSAYRTGDAFGFRACDATVRADMWLSLTRAKGGGTLLDSWLRHFKPSGDSAAGLLQAARTLGRSRALVFLISDFHFPLDLLQTLLDALSAHHVVPVVVWDRNEFPTITRFGIGTLSDSETGRLRTVLLRPSLQRRLAQTFVERQNALQEIFLAHRLQPLMLVDGFNADRVTQYFLDPHAPATLA
jgi:uncharacterized protein (DUF58 family)